MKTHRLRNTLWSNERRSSRRDTITADLEYRVMCDQEVVRTGSGRTVDLSNGGILFESDEGLPVGSDIEAAIAWPVLLENEVALNLCVSGRVSRSSDGKSAIKITNHEFCLRGRYRLSGPRFPRRVAARHALAAAALTGSNTHPARSRRSCKGHGPVKSAGPTCRL